MSNIQNYNFAVVLEYMIVTFFVIFYNIFQLLYHFAPSKINIDILKFQIVAIFEVVIDLF